MFSTTVLNHHGVTFFETQRLSPNLTTRLQRIFTKPNELLSCNILLSYDRYCLHSKKCRLATPLNNKAPSFQPKIDQSCSKSLPIVGIVDYIYFQDIEKLIQSSDLVVVGQPLTELGPDTTLRSIKAQENYPPFNLPINQSLVITDTFGGTTGNWTLTSFKVEQTLKG